MLQNPPSPRRFHASHLLRSLACLTLLLFGSGNLLAQVTWLGTTSSDWTVAANWSTGQVPTAADDVVIPIVNLPAVPPVTFGSPTCRDLTVQPGAQLTLAPLVALLAYGTIDIDGTVINGGTIELRGAAPATIQGDAVLPSLVVDKDSAVAVTLASGLQIGGSFTMREGVLSATGLVTFALPASFIGGSLANVGSYTFETSVAFTGTQVTAAPPMRVLGDWASDATFAPVSGSVVFDGNTTLAGAPSFFNVTIDIGAGQNNVVTVAVPTLVRGSLSIRGNAVIEGEQPLTVLGDFDLDNGGTFDTRGNTHQFGRSLTIDGLVQGGGTFACDGASNGTLAASQPIPALLCQKTGVSVLTLGGSSTIVVQGALTLDSGIMTVSQTTRVVGVSTFAGGSLTGNALLDLDNDANFVGSSVTLPPTISCSGNWTADSFYDPASGTVTLDGTPGTSQSIDISATSFGTKANFAILAISAGASVTAVSAIRVRVAMTVSGQFVAAEAMDIDGSFTVAANAVFDASSFTHAFAGSVALQTTIQVDGTGVFVFDGSASATMSTGAANVRIPNVRVEKTGGATLTFGGTFEIDGALQFLSGRLSSLANAGAFVTVTGDATFSGGHLGSSIYPFTFEVLGDVVSSGAVAVAPPSIRFAGNWTSDNLFAPQSGAVTAIGTAPKVMTSSSGPLRLSAFVVEFGSSISTQDPIECDSVSVSGALATTAAVACAGSFTIAAQGTFNGGAATHAIGGNLSCSGNLVATGTLVFDGDVAAVVSSVDPLPRVRVAKTQSAQLRISNTTITGDLELVRGDLITSLSIPVGGDLLLQGGRVFDATFNVDGNIVCSGTQTLTVFTVPSPTVNLTCQGDFIGHVAFRPVAGTLTMTGQNATLSGSLELNSLSVPTNAIVRATAPMLLTGPLDVGGVLDCRTDNQPLQVASNVNLGNGAQLQLGNLNYRFGASLNAALGAVARAPGTVIEFFGPTNGSVSHNAQAPLPPVVIRKDGVASLSTSGAIDVDGDLTLLGGTLAVGSTMRVRGAAGMHFGSLTGGGTMTVDGDVTFDGALGLTPPNIVVKGAWSANSLFRPTVRTVTFAGAGTTQQVGGSEGRFFNLGLSVSANVVSAVPMRVDGSLDINSAFLTSNSTADFVVAGGVTTTGSLTVAQRVVVAGNLTASGSVVVGGQLEVGGDASIPSGTMSLAGGRFSGSLLADGGFTSSAAVLFDGDLAETLRSAAPLPTITIDRAPVSTMTFAPGLQINGDLLLQEGTIEISGTTAVTGGALLSGGVVSGSGTIDVDGDISFAGTLGYAPPNLISRGNFTCASDFHPFSGTVTLNSNQPQTIFGAEATFHNLLIETFSSVNSDVDMHFNGNCTVQGLLTTTAAIDCDGDFTSNGAWNAGSGEHHFGSNLSIQGGLLASGLFVIDGTTNDALVTSAQPVPALRVDRDLQCTLSTLVVTDDLELLRGRLQVTGTVTVGGDALLSAGELSGVGAGQLEVVGNFVSLGVVVATPPTIRVAGDWTSDSQFAPVSGLVKFEGIATQTIASPATQLQFQAVEVANNANVQTAKPLLIGGTLTVNGSLTTTATLQLDASLVSNTESELNLGSGLHRFAGSVSIGGVLNATGTFDFVNVTSTIANVNSAVPIPNVRKTGAGTLGLGNGLVVAGNLDAERGRLRYGNPVTIQGNAILRGGDLDSGSLLDVQGNVTFLGATATNPGTIRCAGNWASESNFTPPSGRVELTGTGTITSLTPNEVASFHLLDVLSGVRTVVGAISVRGTSMLVQSPGTLRVAAGASLAIERALVSVFGSLEVVSDGELLLGELATVRIEQIGSCRLLGANATTPARVDGLDGGNYSFVVHGFFAARDFEFFAPDAAGLDIRATATIDTSPTAGFRNGTFDFPRNVPNATLMTIVPPTSPPVVLNLQNIRFQNTQGAANVSNVRVSAAGEAINFVNATGSFAGASFEHDPLDNVAWTSGQLTILDSFSVVPGLNSAIVNWTTIDESTVTSFTLDRQILSPTPSAFGNAIQFASTGVPTARQEVISGLVPGFTYRIRLREQATPTSALTTIATADVVPFAFSVVPEIFEVGQGGFVTIQEGINAALGSGEAAPVVRIRPGSYESFTVNGAPAKGLRIVADGSGPVVIATAASTPVTIQNVPFGRFVEVVGLSIGSTSSPVTGVLVTGSNGTVVLDEISVEAGAASAVVVQASTAFVLQGPNTAVQSLAGDGVLLDASSATISNCNLSSIRLQNNSQLVHAANNVAPIVAPGSTQLGLPGVMPDLRGQHFPVISEPLQFLFEGFPSSLWLLVMSDNYSLPFNLFEMPILVDVSTLVVAHTGVTDAAGVATQSSFLPANGALIGETKVFQAAALNVNTGALRLSNGYAITIVAEN